MTRGAQLRADLLAGFTVALVGLPQCLAYAMMSGMPPAYGIATAAVPGLVAALAGRSAQIVTGPTNTTGLLILSALVPFLGANGLIGREALPALATLTLLAGVTRLVLGYAGGASLLRFLPESVLVGFTAGAGILIATMQLDEALGLPPVSRTGLTGELESLFGYFGSGILPAPAALVVTVAIVLALSVGRRFLRRGPTALLALTAVTAAAWFFDWSAASGLPLVADRAPVPGGWPETALPDLSFGLIRQFFVPALAITLLGTLELAVSARARGARPDMKREILAQGFANVAGSFSGSFPASASLTRSALLALGGARSRLAAGSAAVLVVPILFLGASSLSYIPQAALAGILFVTAYGMIDWEAMGRMWRATPATRALLVVTLGSALLLPLEWAILTGAGLGLVIHLARTSIPRIRLLEPLGPNVERLVPLSKDRSPEIVVLEVSGDLHYAAVEPFLTEAEQRLPEGARTLVMDLTHAHEMRFTALVALERFADDLEAKGVKLFLAGVPGDVLEMMESSGSHLSATPAEVEPVLSVRKCIQSMEERSPQER
jgi:SulP family sulfate permease